MKRLFTALCATFLALCATAQDDNPNTKWPYLYNEFAPGTIFFSGDKKSQASLNIHVQGNVLHYVSAADGRIYESSDRDVVRVEIGSVPYIFSNHRLMEIRGARQNNLLLLLTRADWDAMQSSGGAYGASLNSSAARGLSSLDLGGLGNPELGKMLQEKNDGSSIPVVRQYFFVIGGVEVEADRKAVEKLLPPERLAAWKAFLKSAKPKWKKEESLMQVLGFLSE